MGLTEYLRYVYGLLEGRTARYTVYSTDRKLLDNRHRQNTLDYHTLPILRYRWKTVESYGGTWWTYMTCRVLLYSATVVKLTNYDFPSPG